MEVLPLKARKQMQSNRPPIATNGTVRYRRVRGEMRPGCAGLVPECGGISIKALFFKRTMRGPISTHATKADAPPTCSRTAHQHATACCTHWVQTYP